MWKPSSFTLPSVLIVESGKGDLFIVDNETSESQVDRILKKRKKNSSSEVKVEIRETSPERPSPATSPLPMTVVIKEEIKEEEIEEEVKEQSNEVNEGYDSDDIISYSPINVPLTDPSAIIKAFRTEEELKLEQTKIYPPEPTFDGKWSSDEEGLAVDDDEYLEEIHFKDKSHQQNKNDHHDVDDSRNSNQADEIDHHDMDDDSHNSNQADDRRSDGFSSSDDEVLAQKVKTPILKPMPKLTPKPRPMRGKNPGARSHFWRHKRNPMVGKIGCKYCVTFFFTKAEREAHKCKYLECHPRNFICRVCGKELSKRTFSNHLHETLACEYCKKKFVNPRNMKEHIKNQHSDKEFKHSQALSFADYQREQEELRMSQSHRYECDYCGKYIFSLRSLAYHMRMHTGLRKTFICETCGVNFFSSAGVKKHNCTLVRKRPDPDLWKTDARYCRFCDKSFDDMDQRNNHPCSAAVPGEPKYVNCRCCGKKTMKRHFTVHMEIHTGIDWICHICNKQLTTKRSLRSHMTMHTGEKPRKCTQCPESFISGKALNRHMRFHGAEVRLFSCEYCFKQLASSASLKNHVRRVHVSKMLKCEICPREFESRVDVKHHMVHEHGPFVCKFCNKHCSRPSVLKTHEYEHASSKDRYPCPVKQCGKLFLLEKIKNHVFRNHRDKFDDWIIKHNNALARSL